MTTLASPLQLARLAKLAVLVVLTSQSLAHAGPAATSGEAPRFSLPPGGLRLDLPRLRQPITRDMQIQALGHKGVSLPGSLMGGVVRTGAATPLAAFQQGIVLAPPYHSIYPATASDDTALARFASRHVMVSPSVSPPNPADNPTCISMYAEGDDRYFSFWVRWPAAGQYLVTFSMSGQISAHWLPRLEADSLSQDLTLNPDDPANPSQWTILLNVAAAGSDMLSLKPPLGYIASVTLFQITIRKL